jgi:hypothetical protein
VDEMIRNLGWKYVLRTALYVSDLRASLHWNNDWRPTFLADFHSFPQDIQVYTKKGHSEAPSLVPYQSVVRKKY